MKSPRILRLALPSSLLCALAASAHAGILLGTPLSLVVGSGAGTATALTTAPNNYPTATNVNNLTAAVTINTMASPLDLVLQGVNSGGVTQYRATVSVANATPTAFGSYAFQLGTGTGTAFVPFTGTGASTGVVSFLPATPAATSSNFTTATQANSLLTFSNGTIPVGGTASFSFNLAVPDFAAQTFSLTLRETPQAVPEPSAFAALGLGAVALLGRRKRA